METQVLEQLEQVEQKIKLVDGAFTPSEASDVISALIDEKINFHKIHRLKIWEGNHHCETTELNGRIEELQNEKIVAKEFINKVRAMGGMLRINGHLEISLAEEV